MILFGIDVSHHQDERLDLARARREGIDFVFIKATEGASFNDPEFAGNLAEARAAGLLVAAYHYQRIDPVAAQVANVRDSVPLDVPVILDVERDSGSVALTRQLIDALRVAGYRVPLLYLPRWYWQQLGSPTLTGLPPLWSSRYPDRVSGSIQDEWADVPTHYWNGYGGLDVAVLQFTSSAAIAGHQPIDANAYRGTRRQLVELLGGNQENDVTPDESAALFEIRDALREVGKQTTIGAEKGVWPHHTNYPATVADAASYAWQALNILQELRIRPPADVDEAALADELIASGLTAGASKRDVEEVIRTAFTRAGQPNDVPATE